jgi:Protein of unknown function (DUF4239)
MRGLDRHFSEAAWGPRAIQAATAAAVLTALGLLWFWTGWQPPTRALLTLGAFVALCEVAALGGMLIVRRSVRVATLEAHKDYAGFVFSTLGAAYAVLLSFMVVVSWNQYSAAEQTATQEAIAVATLFHLTDGIDSSIRNELRQTLLAYNQTVLDEEWPAMERGGESERAWGLSDKLWDIYMRVPATEQAHAAYIQSLTTMQQFYGLRGQRLLQSRDKLPVAVWVVLTAGAIITVAFTYLFGVRNPISQAVMTAALTAVIAGSLYLIFDLETPYSGPLHVAPIPYQSNQAFFTTRLQE